MLPKERKCSFCNADFLYVRGMSYTKKTCSPECHSKYMSSKRKMADNPNWKGDEVKKHPLHSWIRDNFKSNGICDFCKKEKKTEWSNKDHNYSRNREDWQELCRKCHMQYDYDVLGLRTVGVTR